MTDDELIERLRKAQSQREWYAYRGNVFSLIEELRRTRDKLKGTTFIQNARIGGLKKRIKALESTNAALTATAALRQQRIAELEATIIAYGSPLPEPPEGKRPSSMKDAIRFASGVTPMVKPTEFGGPPELSDE